MAGDITESKEYQQVSRKIGELGVEESDRHQMTLDVLGVPQDDSSRWAVRRKARAERRSGRKERRSGVLGAKAERAESKGRPVRAARLRARAEKQQMGSDQVTRKYIQKEKRKGRL